MRGHTVSQLMCGGQSTSDMLVFNFHLARNRASCLLLHKPCQLARKLCGLSPASASHLATRALELQMCTPMPSLMEFLEIHTQILTPAQQAPHPLHGLPRPSIFSISSLAWFYFLPESPVNDGWRGSVAL